MVKRRILAALVLWLSLAIGPVQAQRPRLPNPSEFLSAFGYNAFGERPSPSDVQFNAFAGQVVDDSWKGRIKGGLREQAWLGHIVWLDVDYLLLFIQPAQVPPLLTTGDVADPVPGALGQPGTRILDEGRRDYGPFMANRLRLTWSIIPQLELTSSFLITEQRADIVNFDSDAEGSPLLARPFFNPVTGQQDADPRAIPNIMQGTTHSSVRARFAAADLLVRYLQAPRQDGPIWSVIVGPSYLHFAEELFTADFSRELPLGTGSSFFISDRFAATNQLYGGLMGVELNWCLPDGILQFYGKLHMGAMEQLLRINGVTTITAPDGSSVTDPSQGLYAQPTNVGSYHDWRFGVVPEVGLNLSYNIHARIRLNLGYSFLYLVNAVRPADQIDPRVNIQPILGPITEPQLPELTRMRTTNLWIQYINFGITIAF